MSFKVQINSLDALIRLLGDPSPEMMLEIRGSVIQEFAKVHIKTIALEEIYAIKSAAREAMTKIAEEQLGKYSQANTYPYSTTFQFKQDVKDSIAQSVELELGASIHDELEKYLDNQDIKSMIERKIDRKITILIEERVNAGVRARWAEITKTVTES